MKPIKSLLPLVVTAGILLLPAGCRIPALVQSKSNLQAPDHFENRKDSVSSGTLPYRRFFSDSLLCSLLDTAFLQNQEWNGMLQEVNIARNEIRARKGEYLPFVRGAGGAGVEKVGLYTSQGANDARTDITGGKRIPEYLPNLFGGAVASWEADIWRRLRNARDAASHRFLATQEGRNFLATRLVAEIASSYFELQALDNQLQILRSNISIQQNALDIVRLEKSSARVTELAIKKFEAEVFKNQSRQYELLQQIKATENRINFLAGRAPGPVRRTPVNLSRYTPQQVSAGLPADLILNRPDIRQAEQNLMAARLDVRVARACFLPSLSFDAVLGLQAFSPAYFLKAPESVLLSMGGNLIGPLVNRNALKAAYQSAGSRQIQALYSYDRSILNGLAEVSTCIAQIDNLAENANLKSRQVEALDKSIEISLGLFTSARADYMEVLMTQRDAVEARFDLAETRRQQMTAVVNLYVALGGGWRTASR